MRRSFCRFLGLGPAETERPFGGSRSQFPVAIPQGASSQSPHERRSNIRKETKVKPSMKDEIKGNLQDAKGRHSGAYCLSSMRFVPGRAQELSPLMQFNVPRKGRCTC